MVVTDNSIDITGLSYTESHTLLVVATSAVCPGVLNNTDVSVMFNVRSKWNTKVCISLWLFFSALVLTQPSGFVDCSNPSLPISGSWSAMEGVSE